MHANLLELAISFLPRQQNTQSSAKTFTEQYHRRNFVCDGGDMLPPLLKVVVTVTCNLKFFTHCFFAEKDYRRPQVLQILQETHRKPIKRPKLWGTGSLWCAKTEDLRVGWERPTATGAEVVWSETDSWHVVIDSERCFLSGFHNRLYRHDVPSKPIV